MIRFSAVLVVVAMAMLAGGVATSRLSLVYIAIAVSAGALLTLAVGVALKRRELFGEGPALVPAGAGGGPGLPFPAGDGNPQPNGSAASQTIEFPAQAAGPVGDGQDRDRPAFGAGTFGPGGFGRPGGPAAPWQSPPARDPWLAPDTIQDSHHPGNVAEHAVGGWSAPPRGGDAGGWGDQDAPGTEPGRSPLPGRHGRKPGADQTPHPQSAGDRTAPAAGFTPPEPPPSPAQSWRDRRGASLDDPVGTGTASGSAGSAGGSEPPSPSSWLAPSAPSPGSPGSAAPWGERPVPSFHPTPPAPGSAPPADAGAKTPTWFDRPATAKPPAPARPDTAGGSGKGESGKGKNAAAAGAAAASEPGISGEKRPGKGLPGGPGEQESPHADAVSGTSAPDPAAADGDQADSPALDAGDRRSTAADDAKDTVPAPASEDAGTEASEGADSTDGASAEDEDTEDAGNTAEKTGAGGENGASADRGSGANLVTVVPGVPRYHDSNCILIRFMSDDDVQKLTVAEAREAGCTPCAACQPED